jgi:hypothetical protein
LVPHIGVISRFHGRRLGPWWIGPTGRTTLLVVGAPLSLDMSPKPLNNGIALNLKTS